MGGLSYKEALYFSLQLLKIYMMLLMFIGSLLQILDIKVHFKSFASMPVLSHKTSHGLLKLQVIKAKKQKPFEEKGKISHSNKSL